MPNPPRGWAARRCSVGSVERGSERWCWHGVCAHGIDQPCECGLSSWEYRSGAMGSGNTKQKYEVAPPPQQQQPGYHDHRHGPYQQPPSAQAQQHINRHQPQSSPLSRVRQEYRQSHSGLSQSHSGLSQSHSGLSAQGSKTAPIFSFGQQPQHMPQQQQPPWQQEHQKQPMAFAQIGHHVEPKRRLSVDTSQNGNDLDALLNEFQQDDEVAEETAKLLFGMLEHWRTPAAGAMLMHSTKSLCVPGSKYALGKVTDPNNNTGNTLLIAAALYAHTEFCRLLLRQGKTIVDVNKQNFNGATALHMACGGGGASQKSFLLVEVLVEHGARSDIQDREGKTALHVAGQDGDADMIALLLLHGGNTDTRDRFGCTPFDYAARRGHRKAVDLLTPKGGGPGSGFGRNPDPYASPQRGGFHGHHNASSNAFHHQAVHNQAASIMQHQHQQPPGYPHQQYPSGGGGAQQRSREWEQVWDPANACYYYYNRQTGMSSWDPPPNMSVVSPAHYNSPVGGSLYTRTWREGDEDITYEPTYKTSPNSDWARKSQEPDDLDIDTDGLWGPPMSPKGRSNHGGGFGENVSSPPGGGSTYRQSKQYSPSPAKAEVEKLRQQLEMKSQEMIKLREESELAQAKAEAAKAEAALAKARAANQSKSLEESKSAKERELEETVSAMMAEQAKMQAEMVQKIEESAKAASEAAQAAERKTVSEEELARQTKIEEELQRRNEELERVRKALDDAERKRKEAEEEATRARKEGEVAVISKVDELKRQAVLELEEKESQMQRRVEEMDRKLKEELRQQEARAEQARQAEAMALAKVDHLMRDLKGREEKIGNIQEQLAEMEKKDEISQKELAHKAELERRQKRLEEEAELMNKQMHQFNIENTQLREDFFAEQRERRKYLEELEHMKGTIRVLCRVRPMEQGASDADMALNFPDPQTVRLRQDTTSVMGVSRTIRKSYEFDSVFQPGCTQAQVFAQARPMIQNAVDGFNVCLFAYGQTGSGKTFTMSGPEGSWGSGDKDDVDADVDETMYGVAPRSVIELFAIQARLAGKIEVSVRFSMLELYRDHLEDLLLGNSSRSKLTIKKDPRGIVYVHNLTSASVSSPTDVETLMRRGHKQRHTAATLMNSESSRSHLLMTFNIDCLNLNTKISTVGKLTLVDLAGSERVGKSGTSGVSMAEGTAINKSLTALGDVISALTTGSKHIPYRNHPLTMLMSDSLGGNAKTLMFVNVSPNASNADETLSSLQYASRVKKVSNKSSKTIETNEIKKLKKQLAKMNKDKD